MIVEKASEGLLLLHSELNQASLKIVQMQNISSRIERPADVVVVESGWIQNIPNKRVDSSPSILHRHLKKSIRTNEYDPMHVNGVFCAAAFWYESHDSWHASHAYSDSIECCSECAATRRGQAAVSIAGQTGPPLRLIPNYWHCFLNYSRSDKEFHLSHFYWMNSSHSQYRWMWRWPVLDFLIAIQWNNRFRIPRKIIINGLFYRLFFACNKFVCTGEFIAPFEHNSTLKRINKFVRKAHIAHVISIEFVASIAGSLAKMNEIRVSIENNLCFPFLFWMFAKQSYFCSCRVSTLWFLQQSTILIASASLLLQCVCIWMSVFPIYLLRWKCKWSPAQRAFIGVTHQQNNF